jgi:hypothetical protein
MKRTMWRKMQARERNDLIVKRSSTVCMEMGIGEIKPQ